MTYPDDAQELLFVPPNVEQPPRFVVGVLEEWNPVTFANAVRYRGAVLRNLPVINRVEALSFTPGQMVSLLGHSGTETFNSFGILGSYLQPGSTAAEEAIAFLQGELARQISSEIFAERIHSAKVLTGEEMASPSTTFGDLPTVGPRITDVLIEVGVAIISVGCKVRVDLGNVPDLMGGYMSCQVSGASSQAPSTDDSFYHELHEQVISGATLEMASAARASYVYPVTGLNPGLHTFTAKYAVTNADDTSVLFSDRQMVVIAF